MITVTIIKNTPCAVRADVIKKRVTQVFKEHGITSQAEVEIAIVNAPEMLGYVEKYLNETGKVAAEHPVLSFVQMEIEGPFQFPPDNILHLGEIIVSFPHAQRIAKVQNKSETEAVCELSEHAALHLLGIHHE